MAFANKILTSLHGRRFGLQRMSTAESGGSRGAKEYLVGPEHLRQDVSTAESTGTNLHPFGISSLPGTSAGSSAVYTIDPPVPGVRKTIWSDGANGPVFLKTANAETLRSTLGTSFTTVKISTLGGAFDMVGLTTAIWGLIGVTSGTSSQAGGFALTTST